MDIKCTGWKAIDKGAVVGFAELYFPDMGMTMHDCMVLTGKNGRWCKPPSMPMINKNGQQMLREDGKKSYREIIKFDARDDSDAWSTAALKAIDEFNGKAAPAKGKPPVNRQGPGGDEPAFDDPLPF